MADANLVRELRRRGYLDEVATLGLGRLRVLCGTLGGLSLVFGAYEASAKPEVFQATMTERIVFLGVCAALVAMTFLGSRQTGPRRLDVRRMVFPMTLAFVAAMLWMMEGIVGAADASKPLYPFTALVLLGPAAALMLPLRMWQSVVMVAVIVGGHVLSLTVAARPDRWANVNDETMVLMASGVIAVVATLITDRLRWRMFENREALELERARSKQLLDNVLPASVAERMIDFGCNDTSGICLFETFADHFDEASILFADIVGFTPLASKLPPAALLHGLNDIFMAFDAIAEELGVYKVKTIGDAYMAAAGVPEAKEDHAEALAEMGLRMIAHVAANPLLGEHPVELRIGIHSGPIVAGVIGLTGFTYDVWGDTVNVASRMESHGVIGAVQVSDATAAALHDRYRLESRGEMDVKGKGRMTTWLVQGPRVAEAPVAVAAVSAGAA